jgi:TATA-binding protein-associated factor Taf7
MAVTANKRRKIDHVSSGAEEDDAASFASFSDSGNAEAAEDVDEDVDQEMQDGSDGEEDDSENEEPAAAKDTNLRSNSLLQQSGDKLDGTLRKMRLLPAQAHSHPAPSRAICLKCRSTSFWNS